MCFTVGLASVALKFNRKNVFCVKRPWEYNNKNYAGSAHKYFIVFILVNMLSFTFKIISIYLLKKCVIVYTAK